MKPITFVLLPNSNVEKTKRWPLPLPRNEFNECKRESLSFLLNPFEPNSCLPSLDGYGSAEAAFVSREHVEAEASIASFVIQVTNACQGIGVLGLSLSTSLSLSLSLSPFKLCVFLADSVMCSSRRCVSTTRISDGKLEFHDNCLILYSDIFISLVLHFQWRGQEWAYSLLFYHFRFTQQSNVNMYSHRFSTILKV
jgi:hypothetical protein